MNAHIISLNESTVQIEAEQSILRELAQRYCFRVKDYQFNPKYKAGIWDGYIRLVNSRNGTAPKGLVPHIINHLIENSYTVTLDDSFKWFKTKYTFDIEKYQLPFEAHDYQIEAVQRALDKKRQIILSPTGSGKSLIINTLIRELLDKIDGKILLIVPTIALVTQMYEDFREYSVNNGWDVEANVHKIYGDSDKVTNKRVVISTYQSIYNDPQDRDVIQKKVNKRGVVYFEDFEAIISDEVHLSSANSITSIMNKSINARYRIGLTGTLDDSLTNELTLIGLFGPVHRVASTLDLMDRGIVSQLKIQFVSLKYDEATCVHLKHADYQAEVDYLVRSPHRNSLICRMANTLKGNTLILVNFVEKHGKVLEQMLKDVCKDRQVFFVYGGTDADDRENIRKLTEQRSDIIILASFKVFSTGVNIKNLPNVMFASPNKSKIRLLQSIGRGLRLHEDKEFCRVIDIADDLRTSKSKKLNKALEHALERLKIYQVEGFEVSEHVVKLNCS